MQQTYLSWYLRVCVQLNVRSQQETTRLLSVGWLDSCSFRAASRDLHATSNGFW
jgi:hypothetical protein